MKRKLFLATVILLALASCTENQKAKEFGGTADIELEPNTKLLMVTWKETNLWYLTRPMVATDTAATYKFNEESDFGVWEGTYIIREVKK